MLWLRDDRGGAMNEFVTAAFRVLDQDRDDLAEYYPDLHGKIIIYGINLKNDSCGGKGHASTLLKEIIDWADKNKRDLVLVPAASGRLQQAELIAWYERNGFVNCYDYMIRQPH